jgi:hypothetical protein
MSKLDVDFRRDFIEALNNIVRRLGQGAKINKAQQVIKYINHSIKNYLHHFFILVILG